MPGDFSSAAPFIVAATLIPESRITIHDVSLNPRRTGLLDVLERMGGRVGILQRRRIGAEQVGDLEVRAAELTATTIHSGEVPLLVDELPLFALLASQARGESWVYGAGELRHKETDRIEAVVDALRAIGGTHQGHDEGFSVTGVPDAAEGRQGRRPRRPPDRDARGCRRACEPRGRRGAGRRDAWRYPSPASSTSWAKSLAERAIGCETQ